MNETEYNALSRNRRSTRLFKDAAVPADVLQRLIEPALEAPTSCNRQLWEIAIVTDAEVKRRMSRLGDANAQSYFYDAPAIIALFYDTSMESRNPCYTPYITVGMTAHAILQAAEAEGLGAIYLGGIQHPPGIATALNAPPHLKNLGVICVGYRDDDPPKPPRRRTDEVVHWNTLEGCPKRSHPDIRPHVWRFDQLADFREKVLWYKGVGFDAATFHVNPDTRISKKMQYFASRAGELIARYSKARVLDVMPHNGDTVLQVLQMLPQGCDTLFAYELTEGTVAFIEERLKRLIDHDNVKYLVNDGAAEPRIPLEADSVDAALCYERLGQFEDPRPLLREVRRVLRPSGRVLVSVSNRWYPHLQRYRRSWRKNYALGLNWNYGPERKYSPRLIERLFSESGFSICSSVGVVPIESVLIRRAMALAERLTKFRAADILSELASQYHPVTDWRRLFCSTLVYEIEKRP